MKKGLFQSYMAGITNQTLGQSYSAILGYFFPEFITALLLYALVNSLDLWLIASLKSTPMYAAQGVTNTLVHVITKIAEGISVGTIVICGQYNGQKDFNNVGRCAVTALWITCCLGACVALFLYSSAYWIYRCYGVPAEMISYGVGLLRVRALAIFFMFIYFALIGFLRGIKNTRTPMVLFIVGVTVFVFFDYALIYGRYGLPEMGLQGSALASAVQYGVMLIGALTYSIFNKDTRKYSLNVLKSFDWPLAHTIISLSWPVVLDKASLAGAKMWLGMMVAPMGVQVIASCAAIELLERIAFIPAIAFAQVITFLVSNDHKVGDWIGIKNNIKKIIFLASVMVVGMLLLFSISPRYIISFFDTACTFTHFAAQAFPVISMVVFFDVLQVILSGALRGAADVKTVMWVRILVLMCYFMPLSYGIAKFLTVAPLLKFILLYAAFYTSNGLMSIFYIARFRSKHWDQQPLPPLLKKAQASSMT